MAGFDPVAAHRNAGIPVSGQSWTDFSADGDDLASVIFTRCTFTRVRFERTGFIGAMFHRLPLRRVHVPRLRPGTHAVGGVPGIARRHHRRGDPLRTKHVRRLHPGYARDRGERRSAHPGREHRREPRLLGPWALAACTDLLEARRRAVRRQGGALALCERARGASRFVVHRGSIVRGLRLRRGGRRRCRPEHGEGRTLQLPHVDVRTRRATLCSGFDLLVVRPHRARCDGSRARRCALRARRMRGGSFRAGAARAGDARAVALALVRLLRRRRARERLGRQHLCGVQPALPSCTAVLVPGCVFDGTDATAAVLERSDLHGVEGSLAGADLTGCQGTVEWRAERERGFDEGGPAGAA